MRKLIHPSSESAEQRGILSLYKAAGCFCIEFSQGFRKERGGTRQTPGIPDLLILHPKSGTWWWHEVKRRKGPQYYAVQYKQTAVQRNFQRLVEAFGHVYVLGSTDDAIAHLQVVGALATPL